MTMQPRIKKQGKFDSNIILESGFFCGWTPKTDLGCSGSAMWVKFVLTVSWPV